MRIAILDDWFDTLRGLSCFERLFGHHVTVFNDHTEDVEVLVDRLADVEALVLIRERTPIGRSLLERLPRLRMISQRSVYPHIDVAACTELGVRVCSDMHPGTPSYSTAELTWALMLAAMRDLSKKVASLRAGKWQSGVGRSVRGRTPGIYGFGRIGRVVADYGNAFGMQVLVWASERSRDQARAEGFRVAESKNSFFAECDVVSLHRLDNAVCTPHIGYVTENEWEIQFADIFDQVNAYAAGAPINVVNPDATNLKRPRPE